MPAFSAQLTWLASSQCEVNESRRASTAAGSKEALTPSMLVAACTACGVRISALLGMHAQ